MEEKDLLEYSQDVLRFEKTLEMRYEGYYERLADQQNLSQEEQAVLRSQVSQEVETLKESAVSLRQAHQWASDKADELTTRLRRVRYGKMMFEDVHGDIDVRNQAVHLKELSMRGMDAEMRTTLIYQASQRSRGYAGFDFHLHNINIAKLVDFAPSLDSIVPMLRSFQGTVDFNVTAETRLDSCLNIKIPSLRSAIHIKGDSLVLMDGETFAEISKKFFFKNKEKNMIDSISVNISVKDGNVTVYPFVIEMDRYRAAVGGTQDLDMNFDYHISILKSPIPFKLGLNIRGNLDKMKFGMGKAKYKDAVTPVEIRKVDSTIVNMGEQIVKDFRRVMQRK